MSSVSVLLSVDLKQQHSAVPMSQSMMYLNSLNIHGAGQHTTGIFGIKTNFCYDRQYSAAWRLDKRVMTR